MDMFGSVCQHELDVHLQVESSDVIDLPEQDAPGFIADSASQSIRLCGSQTPPLLWSVGQFVMLEVSCSAIWTKGSGFLIEFRQVHLDHIMSIVGENCTNQTNMFPCENGNCIPDTMICNGVDNCKDASDESFKTCQMSERCTLPDWYCCAGEGEETYIESSKLCDGYIDCEDGSDEDSFHAGCNDTDLPLCTRRSHFRCKNGACVDGQSLCNNITFCNDGSDENLDAMEDIICTSTGCRPGYSACYDGKTCIRSYSLCDGVEDCPDRSDEDVERCKTTRTENAFHFIIGLIITGTGIIVICIILACCCCKSSNCLRCHKTQTPDTEETQTSLPEEEIAANLPRLPRYDEPVSAQNMPPSYDNIAFNNGQTQSDTYTEIVLRVRTHSNGQGNSTDVNAVVRTDSGLPGGEMDSNMDCRVRNCPPPMYNRVYDDNVNEQGAANGNNEHIELPPPYQHNQTLDEHIPLDSTTNESRSENIQCHTSYDSNDNGNVSYDNRGSHRNDVSFTDQAETLRQLILQRMNRPITTIPLSRRDDTVDEEESYNDILEDIGVDFTPEASSSPKPCDRNPINSNESNIAETSDISLMCGATQNETIESREIMITSNHGDANFNGSYITLGSSTIDESTDYEGHESSSNHNPSIAPKRQRSILKRPATEDDRDSYYDDKQTADVHDGLLTDDQAAEVLEVPMTDNSLQRHLSLDSPFNCFEVGRF
ncbi:unnamed protein product [Owenia fusiformis]|nr:unnamed protein product [Owenia fusiformis]